MKPLLIVLAAASLLGPAAVAQDPAAAPSWQRVWLGPDGAVLPFQTDEEVLEFLRTAEILSMERIPVGITRPRKAVLEKDGIRAHATYKNVDETEERVRLSDDTFAMELRDYFMFEYAAYEISLMLGLDNVPPTVIRRHQRKQASLQIWIEDSMTEFVRREQGPQPPDFMRWKRQVQTMYVFDNLIGNVDRNQGDIVIDSNWKLWMVDHSQAFQSRYKLRHMDEIEICERGLWEKLQALDETEVRKRLDRVLTGPEVESMLERRDTLVAHIQNLIDTRFEGAVLYDLQ